MEVGERKELLHQARIEAKVYGSHDIHFLQIADKLHIAPIELRRLLWPGKDFPGECHQCFEELLPVKD